MQIRKMLIEDYEEIYELWMSCVGLGVNNLDDSKEGISHFLVRNPDTCFVAIDKNIIIGVIIVGNDGRRGYIYHTAVNPDYRNQGIGTKLVDIALQALKKDGIHKVALVVFDRNSKGNAFWERRGFRKREDLVYRNITLTEMVRIDT